ncbi:MAG: AMP-binding protein [Lentimicrobium sp.]
MRDIPETFTINGTQYSKNKLTLLARSLAEVTKTGWEQALGNFLLQWLDERDFIEVTTSGSTGAPKTIILDKAAMVTSSSMTGSFLDLRKGQTALLCLSTTYIAGMMMVVRAMVNRLNLLTVPPSGFPLDDITSGTTIDFAAMVPAQVYNALTSGESEQKLESIGTLIIGGAPLSPELENRIASLEGRIYATFGMTETITHIALRRLNGPDRSDLYTVLPGITLDTDERGCLVVGVPYPDGRKLVTNDLVTIESPKTFRWLGRADHVINCGGIKLIPEVIEKKIASAIKMRFFVHAIPDQKLGEIPVLLVETKTRLSESEQEVILSRIKPMVDKAELPRQIFQTERFSETENGKINRKESFGEATNK